MAQLLRRDAKFGRVGGTSGGGGGLAYGVLAVVNHTLPQLLAKARAEHPSLASSTSDGDGTDAQEPDHDTPWRLMLDSVARARHLDVVVVMCSSQTPTPRKDVFLYAPRGTATADWPALAAIWAAPPLSLQADTPPPAVAAPAPISGATAAAAAGCWVGQWRQLNVDATRKHLLPLLETFLAAAAGATAAAGPGGRSTL